MDKVILICTSNHPLTLGKTYLVLRCTIVNSFTTIYRVCNDNGKISYCNSNSFLTISEYRDKKLNKLWKLEQE